MLRFFSNMRHFASHFKREIICLYLIFRYGEDLRFASFEASSPEILSHYKTSYFKKYLKGCFDTIIVLRIRKLMESRVFIPDQFKFLVEKGSSYYGKYQINGVYKNSFCLVQDTSGSIEIKFQKGHLGIYFFIGCHLGHSLSGSFQIFLDSQGVSIPILNKKIESLHDQWNLCYYQFSDEDKKRIAGSSVKVRWKLEKVKEPLLFTGPVFRLSSKTRRFIVIIADALRPTDLGIYNGGGLTPEIDRFFSKGIAFKNSYAQSNWTLPTFASMALSSYASSHNIVDPDRYLTPLPRSIPTLPELLQNQGFYTYGSVSHQRCNHSLGHHRGFDHFRSIPTVDARDGTLGRAGENNMLLQLNEFCDYFRRLKETNFFGFIHLFDTHFPYFDNSNHLNDQDLLFKETVHHYVKQSFRKNAGSNEIKFIFNRYQSKLAELDYQLGKMFKLFSERENTTVILTSDHGYTFDRNFINTLHDEEIRTPFLIHSNEFALKSASEDYFIESSIDLLPTATHLLGVQDLHQRSGQSIFNSELTLHSKKYAISELVYMNQYRLKIVGLGGVSIILGTSRDRATSKINLDGMAIMVYKPGSLSFDESKRFMLENMRASKLDSSIKVKVEKLLDNLSH